MGKEEEKDDVEVEDFLNCLLATIKIPIYILTLIATTSP